MLSLDATYFLKTLIASFLLAVATDFALDSCGQLSDYRSHGSDKTGSHGCGLSSFLACSLQCNDISTGEVNVPELVLYKQNSSALLDCDGGPLSVYWRFQGRDLNERQKRRLACKTSCQCKLLVSPVTAHTAGSYSCCVEKCSRYACSSKTITVQNFVVSVPNVFMIGAQVPIDIQAPSTAENKTVQIDLVNTSNLLVYTMAKNISLRSQILLNITELPLIVEITSNYRVGVRSKDDRYEGYSNEFHFTFTAIRVDTPVYENGTVMNTSTVHTGHMWYLAFDYDHSNVFMKGVSLYLVTAQYGFYVEHIGTFDAVADRRPATNLWSPQNHTGSFYVIAQDNGTTLAGGGSQMLEILPGTLPT